MSKERFIWLYNETMFKHYIEDKQNNIQLGYGAIVNLLNQQNKQITDLEAKLAESEKKYDKLYECYKKTSSEDLQDKYRLAEENEKLKLQLAEAEEHIDNLELQLREQYQLVDEKEKEIEILNKRVKKYNNEAQKYYEDAYCNDFHNQDKISFAVKKLKEAQIYVDNQHFMNARYKSEKKVYADIWNFIDNQIKQLKEGK